MRRRARSFLTEAAISDLTIVVAILLIIIATAIPNLLLARIADGESIAASSPARAKFMRQF
jgi:hypothetical protein